MPIKKVMVFGTFDIFHPGHVSFIEQAKKYSDKLFVVIARDKTVKEVKGNLPQNNEQQRLEEIKKHLPKAKIILGNLKDKYQAIAKLKPDIICLGYDQRAFTENLQNKLQALGLEKTKIVRLKSYKPDIYKTSKILSQKL
jgi:FAD synthetase